MSSRKVRSESYAIIPWLHHGDQWYFLTQLGYSSLRYDLKVDPMKGKREKGEAPWETAVREAKEESADLLDFSGLRVSGVEGLRPGTETDTAFMFHVEVVASDNLVDLVKSFDVNHEHLSQCADLDKQKKDDLLNHVGLVWTRLTDPRPMAGQGNRTSQEFQLADEPHYRMGEGVWKMIKEECQKSDRGAWSPPAFHARCKLQKIDMGDRHSGCLPAAISYKAVQVETSSSDRSTATTSSMVGQWTHSYGFWAENNREEFLQEWLWKCRRKQCELYPVDEAIMKQNLVTEWSQCSRAEFEKRMRTRAGSGGYDRDRYDDGAYGREHYEDHRGHGGAAPRGGGAEMAAGRRRRREHGGGGGGGAYQNPPRDDRSYRNHHSSGGHRGGGGHDRGGSRKHKNRNEERYPR